MKNHYDVIIIGGGPSAIITGITGIKNSKDKSFLMIMEEKKGLVPCGIPYIFHDLGEVKKNEMGPKGFINAGGEVLIDYVEEIYTDDKTLITKNNKKLTFEKLVFATGSLPKIPTFIEGYDLKNVFYIKKSHNYISKIKNTVDSAKNIVVIGAGFIGCEISEQLAKFDDKKVSLIEIQDHTLPLAFSSDFSAKADETLEKIGVNLHLNSKVEKIIGKDGKVAGVILDSGEKIEADVVISSIGYSPRTGLAKKSGLKINKNFAISVDNYMRTSIEDFYAVGDCSSTRGFITGRTDNIMLASTATAEARILGCNLFKINLLNNFNGTLSVFSTELNGLSFASAGVLEKNAKDKNIGYVVGKFKAVDRHPGTFADTSSLEIKLIANPQNGEIIGAEMAGGKSVGEIINIISLAIQKHVTVYEFISFQIGTHPLLTTAPTKYVLIKAAENAIEKINN